MSIIPLADASRRPKRFPVVTAAIILLNAIVFLFELLGGEPFVKQWSVIPADIVSGQHWVTIISATFMPEARPSPISVGSKNRVKNRTSFRDTFAQEALVCSSYCVILD